MVNFLKGIVIGLGAIAPGLSGSVLLVLFGLYQKTIEAISSTVKSVLGFIGKFFKNIKNLKTLKDEKETKTIWENIKYLVPLILGIGLGAVIFSKIVEYFLTNFSMQTRFTFLGLILGTLPLFYREVKKEGFSKKYYIAIAAAFAVGVFIFYFNTNLFAPISDPSFLQSIVLGLAVATSYIVPGVDSAAILSALGMYDLWVSTIANFDFTVLIPAGIGLVIGVLVVSFIINKLISKCYTLTFSVIFGLFISIIPKVLDESCYNIALNAKTVVSFVLLVVGFVLSLLFSNLDKLAEKKKGEEK